MRILDTTMGSLREAGQSVEKILGRLSLSSGGHGSSTPFIPGISHDWHHDKGDVARSPTMIRVIGGSGT
jgi:hypothetical protein